MTKLQWNEKFDLGVRQVDKQHRRLIELINQLHDVIDAGAQRQDIVTVMDSLVDYTHRHFAEEEALMKSSGYPDLHRHQMQHQHLRNQLQEYVQAYRAKDDSILPQLLTFLQTWLAAHIQGVDQKITPFLP